MNEKEYEVIAIDESTWRIENGIVRFFLLMGTEKALLIDSGIGAENVKGIAQNILKEAGAFDGKEAEIELINTHGDGDHCCGNHEFDWFYMHEGDWGLYQAQFGESDKMRPVKDGDIIDLGERPLKIIENPGHTYGNIAILDISRRVLYAGDSVQDGDIFLFGGHRNLDEFPAGLLKLEELEGEFDKIYASHASYELEPDYIGKVFDACERVFHGEVEPEDRVMFNGQTVHAYDCGVATLLIDKERVFEKSDPEDD